MYIYINIYLCKCLITHPEEGHGGPSVEGAIGDVRLLGQIGGALYRRDHPLDGQESGQVGCVRGDYDEGEKPPDTPDNSSRSRLKICKIF